jgi:hypothetical protein
MPAPSIRPAADPLDDIDRQSSGADSDMARQDRADLPGDRAEHPGPGKGDVYLDAAREVARESIDPIQDALDADRETERVADGDPDVALGDSARGADDDDPIDETERAGDDRIR